MNYLIIGDLHFQTRNKKNVVIDYNKKLKEKLKRGLETGLETNDKYTNNNLTIIFTGDFYNNLTIKKDIDTVWGDERASDKGELALLFAIKEFVEDEGFNIDDIVYVLGNHDFWFDENFKHSQDEKIKYNTDYFSKNYFVKKHISFLCEKVFDLESTCLEDKSFIKNNQLFVGNILYSSFAGKEIIELISNPKENLKSINKYAKALKKVDERERDLSRAMTNFSIRDLNSLIEKTINKSKIKSNVEFFKKIKKSLKQTNKKALSQYNIQLHYQAVLFFLYNYFKIYNEILNNEQNVKEISLVTHFPFDENEIEDILKNTEYKNIKKNKGRYIQHAKSFFSNYFKIKGFWFKLLLKEIENAGVERLNLYSGHTHNSIRIIGNKDNLTINYFQHGLGYSWEQ